MPTVATRALLPSAALLLAACGEQPLSLTLGLEGESAILLLREADALRASAVATRPWQVELQEAPQEAIVLDFEVGLDALGLAEGPLTLGDDETLGLPLPAPDAVRSRVLSGGEYVDPGPLDALPIGVEAARLPIASVSACLEAGGCLDPRAKDALPVCKSTCAELEPPEPPPKPPSTGLTGCRAGWLERPDPDDGATSCLPWTTTLECPAGQAQRPGEDTCTAVGPECPADGWASPPSEAGRIFYVDADAPAGGDGTRAAPFARLADVVADPAGTTTVMLAAGDYEVPTFSSPRVALVGACVTRTRLADARVRTGTLAVSGVTLAGLVVEDARAELAGVVVEATTETVIDVGGGALVAEDLRVRTEAQLSLHAAGGARVAVRRAALPSGVRADGATVELVDTTISGGRVGVQATGGSRVTVRGVLVSGTEAEGLSISEGSDLHAEDLRCEDTGEGGAVSISGESTMTGARIEIARALSYGLFVRNAVAVVEALAIRDLVFSEEEGRTVGVFSGAGADVEVRRARVHGTDGNGGRAVGEGTRLFLSEVEIFDSAAGAIACHELSEVELFDVRVVRAGGTGVSALGGSTVSGGRVRIEGVRPRDGLARGIRAENTSRVDLVDVLLEEVDDQAIYAAEASTWVRIEGLVVRDPRPGLAVGAEAALEGLIELSRFAFDVPGAVGARTRTGGRLVLREGRVGGYREGLTLEVYTRDVTAEDVRFSVTERAVSATRAR